MVLDIIGENHRTRYGIKEEFHMTEECAMYLYEGIQTAGCGKADVWEEPLL